MLLRSPSDLGRRGFTMVEVICAMALLMLATLGFSRALVASMQLADGNRERTLAREAAERLLAEMEDEDFAELLALYDANPANDPDGAGSAPGAGFVVAGLTPVSDDADGLVGAIEFPWTGNALLETAALADFGLPRDLDGSGDVDAFDHAADYRLLPIRVLVRWRSDDGPMQFELRTYLAER